jgi:hydrogenase maturation factor
LIAADPEQAGAIVVSLRNEGIPAAQIGQIKPSGQGCTIRSADGVRRPLPTFARDELARLFDG